jgi:hypothetical protein
MTMMRVLMEDADEYRFQNHFEVTKDRGMKKDARRWDRDLVSSPASSVALLRCVILGRNRGRLGRGPHTGRGKERTWRINVSM